MGLSFLSHELFFRLQKGERASSPVTSTTHAKCAPHYRGYITSRPIGVLWLSQGEDACPESACRRGRNVSAGNRSGTAHLAFALFYPYRTESPLYRSARSSRIFACE